MSEIERLGLMVKLRDGVEPLTAEHALKTLAGIAEQEGGEMQDVMIECLQVLDAELHELAKHEPPMTQRETVKVRIAVAADRFGRWAAYGCMTSDNEMLRDEVKDDLLRDGGDDRVTAISFITAEVPLPVEDELAGEVEAETS